MVQVKVEQGLLEGEHLKLCTGDELYYSFKGIPYAAPPVGELRFKAPQPPQPWKGVLKATNHGPVCPQVDYVPKPGKSVGEDCLFLNVYTPNIKPETLYPVMVYVHGGEFKTGSGNDDDLGPDFLLGHNVILVTLNYRLGVLGFLCLDNEEVPGNAGLKDQVAALKWVHKNIAQFGGDTNNITIFGESAGGAAVSYHLLSPMSKGLFQRVISMSGTSTCEWCSAFESKKRAFALGKQLGIHTNDPSELLKSLQNVSVDEFLTLKTYLNVTEKLIDMPGRIIYFPPVIEKNVGVDHFITEDPKQILKNGKVNKADVFIGYTNNEAVTFLSALEKVIGKCNKYPELFVPRTILVNCTPGEILEISEEIRNFYFKDCETIDFDSMKEFVRFNNDIILIYQIQRFLTLLPTINGCKKFLYQFSCYTSRNKFIQQGFKYGLKGAAHVDDLCHVFSSKPCADIDKNSDDYKMIDQICTILTNFAKYGNPTPDNGLGIVWPEYNDTTKKYINIGQTLTEETLNTDVLQFWDKIYLKARLH